MYKKMLELFKIFKTESSVLQRVLRAHFEAVSFTQPIFQTC